MSFVGVYTRDAHVFTRWMQRGGGGVCVEGVQKSLDLAVLLVSRDRLSAV